jgi:ABC-type phosphate/phosphonate transport system permease subunit
MNKNINNRMDRRKFNFNLLIVAMLIVVFSMQLYNQKLLLNITGAINNIDNKINQYFAPIEDVELPAWEENP